MILTVAFDVKNRVEVMEGWPIKKANITFFVEREGDALKTVCLAFSGVGIEHAPRLISTPTEDTKASITINGGGYATLARKMILNWQAILSGIQIVDLDYDNFELRFKAESIEEEKNIHVSNFKSNNAYNINPTCDFEQLGRAFCAGTISNDRIESTSHFREGRIAFESGRYVDAYNNMYLFLETRYCNGKMGNDKQTDILSRNQKFCNLVEKNAAEFFREINSGLLTHRRSIDIFKPEDTTRDKIKALVLLRGKLRHHSLRSPQRWDPNKQNTYEAPARFLSAVVGDIVIAESLNDIYSTSAKNEFRDISVSTGYETKLVLDTTRLDKKPTLSLEMSYPTTVVSSLLCLTTVRSAISACEREGQISDTVKFEASLKNLGLELLSLEFDVWAYTQERAILSKDTIDFVKCDFEHYRSGFLSKNSFAIPFASSRLSISDVWNLLKFSFNHIEKIDPATRIMNLKLSLKGNRNAIVSYRVGANVRL